MVRIYFLLLTLQIGIPVFRIKVSIMKTEWYGNMHPETGIPVSISRTYSDIVPFWKMGIFPEFILETRKIPEQVLETGKIPEQVLENQKNSQTRSGNRKNLHITFQKLEKFL